MEPDPRAERTQIARKIDEFRADHFVVERAFRIFEIDPIGRCILRNDEQFFDTGADEFFRLAQHIARRSRDEITAQFRDNAEGAPIVTTL